MISNYQWTAPYLYTIGYSLFNVKWGENYFVLKHAIDGAMQLTAISVMSACAHHVIYKSGAGEIREDGR